MERTKVDADSGIAARRRKLAEKYSHAGKLRRYCRGRRALLPLRLGYEVLGAALAAWFIGWWAGVAAFAATFVGEMSEQILDRVGMRRLAATEDAEGAARWVMAGSAAWAVGMAAGVSVIWFGGSEELWILGLAFLIAATINTHLAGSLHLPSLVVMQGIIAATVAVMLGVEAWEYLEGHELDLMRLEIFWISSSIIWVTLFGLFARLHHQNNARHAAERSLIQTGIRLEQTNAELMENREKILKREAEARRLAEEAQAANTAKSEFLAMMSHEIRTPMNGVIGAAEILRETPLTRDQQELLETIERSGNVLLDLINDILDLSRIESGRLEIAVREFDVASLVADVVTIIHPLAEAKSLEFTAEVPDGPFWVRGDEARLRQILINLLGNAVKFTDKGRVALTVTPGETWRFVVSDTGPGISAEDLGRIFEPFEQVGSGMARRHGGTGLGLAISRRLAEAMGGRLEVQSAEGRGSEFCLVVPLPKARGDAAERRATSTDSISLEGRTVLVAEDNKTNAAILGRILRPTGARFVHVTDGEAAIETRFAIDPDVILMDVSMPGLSGTEATRRIREAEAAEGRGRVPIVALTANAFEEDRRACLDAGMDAFLAKPLKKADLFRTLAEVLSAGPDTSGQGAQAAREAPNATAEP